MKSFEIISSSGDRFYVDGEDFSIDQEVLYIYGDNRIPIAAFIRWVGIKPVVDQDSPEAEPWPKAEPWPNPWGGSTSSPLPPGATITCSCCTTYGSTGSIPTT